MGAQRDLHVPVEPPSFTAVGYVALARQVRRTLASFPLAKWIENAVGGNAAATLQCVSLELGRRIDRVV
jgi:hypothetical protein